MQRLISTCAGPQLQSDELEFFRKQVTLNPHFFSNPRDCRIKP